MYNKICILIFYKRILSSIQLYRQIERPGDSSIKAIDRDLLTIYQNLGIQMTDSGDKLYQCHRAFLI